MDTIEVICLEDDDTQIGASWENKTPSKNICPKAYGYCEGAKLNEENFYKICFGKYKHCDKYNQK